MIVYGDAERRADAADLGAALAQDADAALRLSPGLKRHEALAALVVDGGCLIQGLADAALPEGDAIAFTRAAAGTLLTSWRSGFTHAPQLPPAPAPPRGEVRLRRPEGYAYYALYPETYGLAARQLPRDAPIAVTGIRSIGAGLACMVAAGANAAQIATVRPSGHPFRRRAALTAPDAATARHAIADEGPGLSGSSFVAVVEALRAQGASPGRIHLFPSHDGAPGAAASAETHALWAALRRHVCPFETAVAPLLPQWAAETTGRATAPPADLSRGGWRALLYADPAQWPPVYRYAERRKYLLEAEGRRWLLKFAGLGRYGRETFARARMLGAAGLSPCAAGFAHGFLIMPWLDGARPLTDADGARTEVQAALARYVAFRARRMPAEAEDGASLSALFRMLRYNAKQALGAQAARRAMAFASAPARFESAVRRCATDNRMHAWEWLALPDGRIVKTDSADHAFGHDLAGCQDIGWDVAGAAHAFRLDAAAEQALLTAAAAARGSPVPDGLYAFLRAAYLALQIGHCALSAQALAGEPDEAARLSRAQRGCEEALAQALHAYAA